MLSDRDIADLLLAGRIVLDPSPPLDRLQPVSIDVTLGPGIRTFTRSRSREVRLSDIPADLTDAADYADGFRLRPGQFVLATTAEVLTLPADVAARLEGKSTNGRLGLAVHATAGLIDPGFSGHVTLEISNVGDLVIVLEPGELIGQLTFEAVSSPCARPYGSEALGSHYQGQRGPTPPAARAPGRRSPTGPGNSGQDGRVAPQRVGLGCRAAGPDVDR